MNCANAETLLTEYLDGGLEAPVRAAISDHLRQCAACSELAAGIGQVRHELSRLPKLQARQELVDSILDRTSGRPKQVSIWRDLILPTLQPFCTQRYAFATLIMFVFLSLAANLAGPEFTASSASSLRPSNIAQKADQISGQIYRKWMEFNEFKSRAAEEFRLLREDLFGRIDYHLITMLFQSYDESLQQDSDTGEESEKDATTGEQNE